MKMPVTILLLLIVVFLFSFCDKPPLPEDFTIGQEENVNTTSKKTIFLSADYGGGIKCRNLDIDSNGVNDIIIKVFAENPEGTNVTQWTSIVSQESHIQIGYMASSEPLFLVKKDSDTGSYYVIYNERSHFFCIDCQNLGNLDDETDFQSAYCLHLGDPIPEDIKWSDKTQHLSEFDQKQDISLSDYDLPVHNHIFKGLWNNLEGFGNIGYLPIRSTLTNPTSYGWIKISINDHSDIEILEIAI